MKHNQDGAINALLIPLILASLFLIGAIGFGAWSFASRQDYKTNVDQKISDAVTLAKQEESTAKDKQFVEAEKQPLRTYSGPSAYGSIVLQYPKTWSGYIDDTSHGGADVNGFFHPGLVPSLTDSKSLFSLRVQVLGQAYASALSPFASLQKSGKVTIAPYALPKVKDVIGVRIDGEIGNGKQGSIVILPLRDKTIELATDSNDFVKDFNDNILPNFSFSP